MTEFDYSWEEQYARGKMLNKYPHDRVVSLTFQYVGVVPNRSTVKILDIGCGAGNNSWFFAREGFDVTGVDASPSAIRHVKKWFKHEKLQGDFRNISFLEIDKLDKKFDMILDREALYTADYRDLKEIFGKIRNLMHENSLFISFFYSSDHPDKKFCYDSVDGISFNRIENGAFGGTMRVILLTREALEELYTDFEIIELYRHAIEPIKNTLKTSNGMSEWIIIAKKKEGDNGYA